MQSGNYLASQNYATDKAIPGQQKGQTRPIQPGQYTAPSFADAPRFGLNTVANAAGAGNAANGTTGQTQARLTNNLNGANQNAVDDINAFHTDMTKRQDANWAGQQQQLQNQMGAGQRMAAETNARMGRSIGGGFAGLQGQAQAQGMNEMQKAWLAYQDQRNGTDRDWQSQLVNQKNRQTDLNVHLWDVNHQDQVNAAAKAGETPSPGVYNNIAPGTGTTPGAGATANVPGAGQNIVGAMSLMGVDINSGPGETMRKEMSDYIAQVYKTTGRVPSAGELRDRMRNTGRYNG